MAPHLTPELVRAYRRGQISYDELLDVLFGHTAVVCTHCRPGCEALDNPPAPQDLALCLESFRGIGRQYETTVLRSEEQARQDLRLLRALPPNLRRNRIERARRRFRGEELVEILLSEARHRLHTDPGEAFHWAELAWTAAWSTPQLSPDTLALACAEMGNARRATGELQRAERIFEHVRYLVERHSVTQLGVLARIQHSEGSLYKDLRRLGKAKKVLRSSALFFRLTEDSQGLGRSLMSLADAYFYGGELESALSTIRQTLEIFPSESHAHLWARHNLACYLVDAGRVEEAALIRKSDDRLDGQVFSGVNRFRLFWLDGRIAAGRGEISSAIDFWSQARDGFLDAGFRLGALLVAFDLAFLYARKGRWTEFREVTREIKIGEREYSREGSSHLGPMIKMLDRYARQIT